MNTLKRRGLLVGILVIAMIFTTMPATTAVTYGADGANTQESQTQETEKVFTYNETAYASLDEAIAAVDDSDEVADVITMTGDYDLNGDVASDLDQGVVIDKDVTIDFGGFTFTGSVKGPLLTAKSCKVTILNGKIENTSQDEKAKAVATAKENDQAAEGEFLIGDGYTATIGWEDATNFKIAKSGANLETIYTVNVNTYYNGKLNSTVGKSIVSAQRVSSGGSVTLTNTATKCYGVQKIVVNGVNKGSATTYNVSNITQNTTINVYYEKTGVFILLDAGHAGSQNKGVVSGYYESKRMWVLTNYLKTELNKYPNIRVGMTKTSLADDPGVYARGYMGKGYDLVISLHSNYVSGSSSTDYPLAIVSSNPTLKAIAGPLGTSLAKTVGTTIGCKQPAQVWTKKQSDGRDWFGVIRGAADVGVPAMILEHSFHSNPKAAAWMMSNSNLKKLAVAEAKTIATGITTDSSKTPGAISSFTVRAATAKSNKLTWGSATYATGYMVFRSDTKEGTYKQIASTSSCSYVDTKVESGETYYYKVKASRKAITDKVVYGPLSAVKSIKVAEAAPTVKAIAGGTNIRVTFTSVKNATAYQVYRATAMAGTYTKVATIDATDTLSYKDTNVTAGKAYYYKVRSVNGTELGAFSAIVDGKSKIPATSITVSSGTKRAVIKFKKVTGATYYQVWRSTSPKGTYTRIATIGSYCGPTYVDKRVVSGKTYYYKMRAVGKSNGKALYGALTGVKGVKVR